MLSRLGSLQGRSFLKGGALKNIFRKGLFLCAYSQNGPRVNPYWLFFQVSFTLNQHKTEAKVHKIFRKQLCLLTMLFHSRLPTKLKGKPQLFLIQTCKETTLKTLYHQSGVNPRNRIGSVHTSPLAAHFSSRPHCKQTPFLDSTPPVHGTRKKAAPHSPPKSCPSSQG